MVEDEVEDEVQIIDEHGPSAGIWRRRYTVLLIY
jgi:hypothetical protein